MGRANGLMKRIVVFGTAMDDYMEREGGILKVGLYAPKQGVGDIAGRLQQGMELTSTWGSRVYNFDETVSLAARNAPQLLDEMGYAPLYLTARDSLETPKLHLKANFFASSRLWDTLMSRPEWAGILDEYVRYLALQQGQLNGDAEAHDARDIPAALVEKLKDLLDSYFATLTAEERSELICYLTIGSANMDYRSHALNGEVMCTIGGMRALAGVLDFVLLMGLCEWPDTPEQVDALLPPPGWFTRTTSSFIKVAL
jgi:hypothetical protein